MTTPNEIRRLCLEATKLRDFKQNLRLSDLYYVLAHGLRA